MMPLLTLRIIRFWQVKNTLAHEFAQSICLNAFYVLIKALSIVSVEIFSVHQSWCRLFARLTASSKASFSDSALSSLCSLRLGSQFVASSSGIFGSGIVTKNVLDGITIACDLRKPISFGIVILPLSSIFTTTKQIPHYI